MLLFKIRVSLMVRIRTKVMRMRIRLITPMRIRMRIRFFTLMRIRIRLFAWCGSGSCFFCGCPEPAKVVPILIDFSINYSTLQNIYFLTWNGLCGSGFPFPFYADPDPDFLFDADPDPDFYLMRIRIPMQIHADPGYQKDADPCGSGCRCGSITLALASNVLLRTSPTSSTLTLAQLGIPPRVPCRKSKWGPVLPCPCYLHMKVKTGCKYRYWISKYIFF